MSNPSEPRPDPPDPDLITRRFFRQNKAALIRKIQDYASANDEPGFIEHFLHKLDVWEGMSEYDAALAIFREIRDRQYGGR